MASVEDVQPVDTMWLSPRDPSRMETSLASVPMVPVGMVYTLHGAFRSTAFAVPDGRKRKHWSVSDTRRRKTAKDYTRWLIGTPGWLKASLYVRSSHTARDILPGFAFAAATSFRYWTGSSRDRK